MDNWFYMNRKTFENLLYDELGANLAQKLISIDFDIAVSFMIGETTNEILTKIQQTFSRKFCRKINCNDHCLSCSLSPPNYAKLAWFVQRLIIMSPLTKPFIKHNSSSKSLNDSKDKNTTNCSDSENLIIVLLILFIIIIFFAILQLFS
jgi:hypothetical protein